MSALYIQLDDDDTHPRRWIVRETDTNASLARCATLHEAETIVIDAGRVTRLGEPEE